ncbi:MAG TPA: hypothetical protein VFY84_10045 [Jiangellales bacterium]|nr:hypothetical protein [Jiangellales bacterium]
MLVWRGDTGSIAAAGWVLAWNVDSGDIFRVAQATGDQPVVTVSLGPVAT